MEKKMDVKMEIEIRKRLYRGLSVQILPTLGTQIYRYHLHWARGPKVYDYCLHCARQFKDKIYPGLWFARNKGMDP